MGLHMIGNGEIESCYDPPLHDFEVTIQIGQGADGFRNEDDPVAVATRLTGYPLGQGGGP